MDNPYHKLLLVCGAAEEFIAASKTPDIEKDDLLRIMDCVISAEEILDKGRALAQPGSAAKFRADRQNVDKRMDAIRSESIHLAQRIGRADMMELVLYRGKQTRMQWVVNL
jgi:hypothetical protein